MPAYSGKYHYLDERGGTLGQGPCQVTFDPETCIVTPAAGAPLAFDLGDVDRVIPAEWDLQLVLYTGHTVQLRQFGASFSRMSEELVAAWRDRTVTCLLLEDMDETGRYTGLANGTPAEIRIYRSNLAVLPSGALPTQWRLADIDSALFDDAAYTLTLASGDQRIVLSKLARKTDECRGKLTDAIDELRTRSADALHRAFPFLNAGQVQRLVTAMPEGRTVSLATLASIHSKLPDALITRAVDERLKPYFDALRARSGSAPSMAGFKFVREGDEPEALEGEADAPPPDDAQPMFFWFFFPIPGRDLVAWEATTGIGRATYFFRAAQPVEASAQQLTRGLALVNFRREPVYLPDQSLEQTQRFHRYAIGARKLPDLRALRAAYAGRAIHSNFETWSAQVKGITGS